ncbi:hypothetical protein Tco_0351376 [Tanacetum coccineum]
MSLLTPSDIQHSAATQIWGCYRLVSEPSHSFCINKLSPYTSSSKGTDSEPGRVFWGADEELSDDGSPRVIVYGYDGLPMQPDDETEDGPVDYPIDGGDDGDDDDRITVRLQASISLPPEAEVERLLAMPTPPPLPPISLSPPSAGERLARCTALSAHSSPPPVPSPLLPSSGCPTQTQTLRIKHPLSLIDTVTTCITITSTTTNEVIKSSVENLVPIPSEFEGISDDTSDEPTCDNNRVNVEIDFVESLIDHDTSIVHTSKIDPILEEFAGELAHIAPIPPGIVNADFDLNDGTSSDDDSCNTPKMGRSGIRIRGVLLQDQQHKIYIKTTQKVV